MRLISYRVAALLLSFPCASFAQTGRITGRTTDAAGSAIGGVRVSLDGSALLAITSGTGGYTLDAVPAGSYMARAIRSGFQTLIVPVVVTPGQVTALDFRLDPDAPVNVLVSTGAPANPISPPDLKLPVPDSAIVRMRQSGRLPFTPVVGGRSILPLFANVELTVEVRTVTKTADGYRASAVILARDGSDAGTVVIISRNDRISANVRHGLRLYQVRWQAGTTHLIIEVDRTKLPPEAPGAEDA